MTDHNIHNMTNNTAYCTLCEESIASKQLKRRREFEGTMNVAKKQRTEAPIDTVKIGPSGTTVSRVDFEKLRECSASMATRNLLTLVFDRQTLATSSLSGKPSPAFRYEQRMLKRQLDAKKVSDIIHCIRNAFKISEREIRSTITMKCADVARTFKGKENKSIKNIKN